MPSRFSLTAMNVEHRALIAVSFGRLGWRLGSTPALDLTTVGRRSGEPRSTMLTAPMRVGDGLVVVASRGGDDRHPAWFLNLRENPEVTIRLEGGPPERRRARVMSDEERSRHWPELIRTHTQYAGYQRKTDRVIPLVVLEPEDGAPGA